MDAELVNVCAAAVSLFLGGTAACESVNVVVSEPSFQIPPASLAGGGRRGSGRATSNDSNKQVKVPT